MIYYENKQNLRLQIIHFLFLMYSHFSTVRTDILRLFRRIRAYLRFSGKCALICSFWVFIPKNNVKIKTDAVI
nr:MAG TPA: hypothetical protein [Caudoviricetes sp.]